ncbi:unnamed protein product [Phytomonas sp. Hart1]|nr:unnamed protein product [Phytomonas sp. Hart1]|eukprot:CCW67694.1 unnamed protein product [Phytomonas sp. isolate Hart1]
MLSSHDSSRLTTARSSRQAINGNAPLLGNTSIKDWLQPRLLNLTMQLMYYQPVEPVHVLAKNLYNEYVLLTATDLSARLKNKVNLQKPKTPFSVDSRARSPMPMLSPAFGSDGADKNLDWGTTTSHALIPYGVEALSCYFMPQTNWQASNKVKNMLATIIALLHQQGRYFIHGKSVMGATLHKVHSPSCLVTPLCYETVDAVPLALVVRYLIALGEQELCDIVPGMVDELVLLALLMAWRTLKPVQPCASPLEDYSEDGEVSMEVLCSKLVLFSPRLRLLPASHLCLLSAYLRETIQHHLPFRTLSDVPLSGTAVSGIQSDSQNAIKKKAPMEAGRQAKCADPFQLNLQYQVKSPFCRAQQTQPQTKDLIR